MAKFKHRQSNTKAYKAWAMMRVLASKNNLRIYEEWDDFNAFLSDMGEPKEGQCLLRLDKQKGYYPKNCKWGDKTEMTGHLNNHKILQFQGKTQTVHEWAEGIGIKPNTLLHRLSKLNWTAKEALTTELHTRCRPRKG